jgi:hypothetical protein
MTGPRKRPSGRIPTRRDRLNSSEVVPKLKGVARKKPELQHNANKLAFEQFSELNAMLYRTNPSEYFRTRLHSVAVHANTDAEPVTLPSGATLWLPVSDVDTRLRYAAMEMTVLFHHVAETLIRAYFAHRTQPACPWLEIAKLNNFRKFKEHTDALVNLDLNQWDRRELGQVFMGGYNPADAEVDLDTETWDDQIDGLIQLMVYAGSRLLGDASLYNSAKHGLSSIANAEMKVRLTQGHKTNDFIDGPILAHLRTVPNPENPPSEYYEWNLAITSVALEADIRLVELALIALESMWGCARRTYTGVSAEAWHFSSAYLNALFLKDRSSEFTDIVHTMNHRMATAGRDAATGKRRISGIEVQVVGEKCRQEDIVQAHLFDLDAHRPSKIELPLRDRDRRDLSPSNQHFFPFSPRGSHTKPDPETIIGGWDH